MSNKQRLQTNNTNLQSLIDKANTLPDVGSGSVTPVVICPKLTILGSPNMWDIGAELYLQKVAYYSNNELITLIDSNNTGLNINITNQEYEILNVDANKPVVIECESTGSIPVYKLSTDNLLKTYTSIYQTVAVFMITNNSAATVTVTT